ncbi:MAG: glycosyltransferase family 9 protein [Bdellovibrionales bacterium]|nr:glycosyltransferase family 9 protein [Bdellovibrionales bacterium]
MLEGNSDVDAIVHLPKRPSIRDEIALFTRLFRRFDLVFSTSPSDRSFGNTLMAGGRRFAVRPPMEPKHWWKRLCPVRTLTQDGSTNVVEQNLRLAELAGIPRIPIVVPPHSADAEQHLRALLPFNFRTTPYCVVHLLPSTIYKRWPLREWSKVINVLRNAGLQVVLTSGPLPTDVAYVREAKASFASDVIEIAGRLSFGVLTTLLKSAVCYLGPDTSVTHLAAACGTRTVALYGPTNIRKWGVWPCGYQGSEPPFTGATQVEEHGNVLLLSVPCRCPDIRRVCNVSLAFESACMRTLPAELVIEQLERFLPCSEESGWNQNAAFSPS